jgi:hypothetical protein
MMSLSRNDDGQQQGQNNYEEAAKVRLQDL